jgi:hypothetical protein
VVIPPDYPFWYANASRGHKLTVPFNLLYGARRFVRRLNELSIAIATRSFPTTIAVSITGWMRAYSSRRRCPADVWLMNGSRTTLGR